MASSPDVTPTPVFTLAALTQALLLPIGLLTDRLAVLVLITVAALLC
jgi:hypothetical protein